MGLLKPFKVSVWVLTHLFKFVLLELTLLHCEMNADTSHSICLGSSSGWDYSWSRCACQGWPSELSQEGLSRARCYDYLCNTYIRWSWGLAISYCNLSIILKFIRWVICPTTVKVIFLIFQVYVAHGKLQLAMPMDKVKEISKLSLMVSFLTLKKWNSKLSP